MHIDDRTLTESATGDPARTLLRHTLATLAYRAEKSLRSAPTGFGEFRAAPGSRSAGEILAHMGDLLDWALALAEGQSRWSDVPPQQWTADVERFFVALGKFDAYLASEALLGRPIEQLFQGPVADALTHTGQLTMLRRLAGAPVRGESYARAEIVVGRVGAAQAPPRVEFD